MPSEGDEGRSREDEFQDTWLQTLREQLDSDKEIRANSWGYRQRKRGAEIADVMMRPRTNSSLPVGDAEALVLSGAGYSQVLARGDAVDVPVFLRDQGRWNWGGRRPIDQILDNIPDTCTVDVQEPRNLDDADSYSTVTIAEVKERFRGNKETHLPWNCLDMAPPGVPLLLPPVLQCEECDFLYGIQQQVLGEGTAKRASVNARARKDRRWKQATNWVLIAEGGAISEAHHDSNGYCTWLTVAEGEVCFAWLSNPSEEVLDSYQAGENGNGSYRLSSNWRYVVLQPEETVVFESGLIHSVFRLSGDNQQTMMVGGHFLRRSRAREWLTAFLNQIRNPLGSNEDLDLISKNLVDTGVRLVEQVGHDGSFGNEEARREVREIKAQIDTEWTANFKTTGMRR
ncbi:MAG: hypothetical protein Q9165_000152 [Trypethelium subeluteriae]